ncbi:MAG TPA: FlgD immunoglobulin-like domain containing protein [Candidatus Krumholzibacteria bacterium]|nr:FlgD immunoglobulin-like domain containing protein [Candidatus Krumholzibacteria bacterium]
MREHRVFAILHGYFTGGMISSNDVVRAGRAAGLAVAAVVALAGTARAQCGNAQLQNYTGGGQVVCPCFVVGEQAGAVFTAPASAYPIEILKVGIGWGSQIGGAPNSLEEAIHVYAGGLPNPGAPIFTLPGPQLVDGAINEFNLEPLAGEIVVNSGPFTVTLEFMNQNAGDPFAPSVVHDGNGCQSGKNVVYAVPGGWFNACSLGVTGDWVFYVVYRSVKVTGTANPPHTVISNAPLNQTTCETVYMVNSGCSTLNITSITGCGAAPFSLNTSGTSMSIAPGGSTPIEVCVTPTTGGVDSCLISVASNASNSPTTFRVVLDNLTPVDDTPANGFDIVGVVPNPFNPSTMIRFVVPRTLAVNADVWSVTGERVRTLAQGLTYPAGEHALRWDGRNTGGERVASGVYIVRVATSLGSRSARLVLVQ